jgi:hypothetical protein
LQPPHEEDQRDILRDGRVDYDFERDFQRRFPDRSHRHECVSERYSKAWMASAGTDHEISAIFDQ